MSKLEKLNGVSKLTTTFPLSKLQHVPAWDAPAVARAPHSAGVASAASSTRLASDRTIDRAEPCFITKVSAYTHQQAHWINAIRGTEDKHAESTVIEGFLHSQGIVDTLFSLDDASNLANIDSSLHSATDKYAMFAITCSHKFLDSYIKIITAENDKWQSEIREGRMYIRNLGVLEPSIRYAEYELVVLQPAHFMPDDSMLPLYSRQDGLGKVIGLKHYKMAADNMLREDPGRETSHRFPPFRFLGMRNKLGHTINPYLVMLAAEIKFRRYLAANGPQLPPIYDSLMRKTIQVANLLYFQPTTHESAYYDPIVVDMKAFYAPVNVVDEMGSQAGDTDRSGESTLRQQGKTVTSGGVKRADPNYWRNMLSGRDLELTDDDLDVLRDIEKSNRAASSHGQSLLQVENWRRETVKA